jgi:ketosteroid isomerase-like protein
MPDEDRTIAEARIRELIHDFAAAFRAKDIDGVMSLFSPTVISFDLAPPLRCVGADALRRHWEATLASLHGPVAYEIQELAIEVSDRLAFSHSLNYGCVGRWRTAAPPSAGFAGPPASAKSTVGGR